MNLEFESELWEWQGQGAWVFVSLPKEYYEDIKNMSRSPKKGFGSLKVEVKVGKSIWRTSIFPDTKSGTYLLPVKKEIRNAEKIKVGDVLQIEVRIIDF